MSTLVLENASATRHGWRTVADRRPRRSDSFPELTESVFARIAVWTRSFGAGAFALEARVSHAEPAYAAE